MQNIQLLKYIAFKEEWDYKVYVKNISNKLTPT